MVGSGLLLAGIGAAIGVGASLVLFRPFESLLFGVTPYDASTYLVVVALLIAVTAVASLMPARRMRGWNRSSRSGRNQVRFLVLSDAYPVTAAAAEKSLHLLVERGVLPILKALHLKAVDSPRD